MLFLKPIRYGGFLAACFATLTGALVAQDREKLTEPVFRVVNTNSALPSDRSPVRPELDRTVLASQKKKHGGIAAKPAAVRAPLPAAPPMPVAAQAATGRKAPAAKTVADDPVAQAESLNKHPALLVALRDANTCLDNIQNNVKGYECILRRRENVRGKLLPTEYIRAKIRQQQVVDGVVTVPFSVYLKFLKPDDIKGREILYIEGQNNGKMLVKEGGGGFKARLPSMWLAPTNPLVMKSCRYPISDVGIENLTKKLIKRSTADDGNVPEVDYVAQYEPGAVINKRACNYLKVDFLTRKPVNEASRIEIFIDNDFMFPIRYVAYDWPTNGSENRPILEEYTYLNLKLTDKLTNLDFDQNNPNYNF